VQLHARMAAQPGLDSLVLVAGVVVHDQVQLAARIGAGDRLEEGQELRVAVPLKAAVSDLAVATSRAANSVVVPCRTQSWVRRSARPRRSGRIGWVRSTAWIWDFSSTHGQLASVQRPCASLASRPCCLVRHLAHPAPAWFRRLTLYIQPCAPMGTYALRNGARAAGATNNVRSSQLAPLARRSASTVDPMGRYPSAA
jgi:hypothetical protein